eukprot:31321-Pelagococcus_subviridis.AAC.6
MGESSILSVAAAASSRGDCGGSYGTLFAGAVAFLRRLSPPRAASSSTSSASTSAAIPRGGALLAPAGGVSRGVSRGLFFLSVENRASTNAAASGFGGSVCTATSPSSSSPPSSVVVVAAAAATDSLGRRLFLSVENRASTIAAASGFGGNV